jgi:hypothetical protein
MQIANTAHTRKDAPSDNCKQMDFLAAPLSQKAFGNLAQRTYSYLWTGKSYWVLGVFPSIGWLQPRDYRLSRGRLFFAQRKYSVS